MQWGKLGIGKTEVSEVPFSQGTLRISPPLRLILGLRHPAEGSPQESPAQLVTPAPPQETAPRIPGWPEGLHPDPSAGFTTRA